MAKTNTLYNKGPWDFKKNGINEFIAVNELNRKNAIVLGRILYVITLNGSTNQFRGTFSIDPRFTKGWWKYPAKPWENNFPGHARVFMPEDMEYEHWKASNNDLITKFINEKSLYIKQTDPILKYFKE
jgi:predicted metalloenzyme YecM